MRTAALALAVLLVAASPAALYLGVWLAHALNALAFIAALPVATVALAGYLVCLAEGLE